MEMIVAQKRLGYWYPKRNASFFKRVISYVDGGKDACARVEEQTTQKMLSACPSIFRLRTRHL